MLRVVAPNGGQVVASGIPTRIEWTSAGVENVDSAEIMSIIDIRTRLTTISAESWILDPAWNAYRNADYVRADQELDNVLSTSVSANHVLYAEKNRDGFNHYLVQPNGRVLGDGALYGHTARGPAKQFFIRSPNKSHRNAQKELLLK